MLLSIQQITALFDIGSMKKECTPADRVFLLADFEILFINEAKKKIYCAIERDVIRDNPSFNKYWGHGLLRFFSDIKEREEMSRLQPQLKEAVLAKAKQNVVYQQYEDINETLNQVRGLLVSAFDSQSDKTKLLTEKQQQELIQLLSSMQEFLKLCLNWSDGHINMSIHNTKSDPALEGSFKEYSSSKRIIALTQTLIAIEGAQTSDEVSHLLQQYESQCFDHFLKPYIEQYQTRQQAQRWKTF